MKTYVKRFLLMILVLMLVMAAYAPVALGEPETTGDPDSEQTDDTSDQETADTSDQETDDPADQETADTSDQETFEILKLDSQGVDVIRVQMRLRALGYLNYRATGKYLGMSKEAVMAFQENNGLDADGRVGAQTYDVLFSFETVTRKPLSVAVHVASGPPRREDATGYGELADWSEVIDPAFPVEATVTVTDFNTGESFQMKRTGGVNHANVEVVDADNYEKYIKCFGNEPTWEKRPALVTINGTDYAASLFGNPSGEDTVADNAMAGHTELYFSGSKSDIFGFVDKNHQIQVLTAAGEPAEY